MTASEAKSLLVSSTDSWYEIPGWPLKEINGPVSENADEFLFEAVFRNSKSGKLSVTPYGVNRISGKIVDRTVDED